MGALDGSTHGVDRAGAFVDVDAGGGVRGDLCTEGSPSDVAPQLHPLEADVGECAVGGIAGSAQIGARAGDREHPPAGHPWCTPAVVDRRREDDRSTVVSSVGAVETVDHAAGAGCLGIARCRGHHGAGGTMSDVQRLIGQASLHARHGHLGQIAVEQREQRLCLGVTEPAVVLEQPRPRRGEHQTGVEDAHIAQALAVQMVEHRLHERRRQFVEVVGAGCWGVRAHATGVRAGVALADALVVLRKGQGLRHGAVAEGEQAHLGPAETFFEHERACCGGGPDGGVGVGRGVGHHHTLSRRQAVGLHHHGCFESAPPVDGLFGVVGAQEAGGGDAEPSGQGAGVPLRRLEPGQLGGRAETGHAGRGAAIGHPCHQGRLGPDDHQVGAGDAVVGRIGGDHHLVAVPTAGPCDGGLAPATAHDQYPHQASTPSKPSFGWARATSMG